ncbi:MAG: hypothetical protein AOA66_1072 [Candidatus Bathyarchaeota archaeon BA2]|nr:MAG: hypothetical protein AOA66_1072 [Candidatus Bathyarchaeota archaeon BA2]
MSRKLRMKCRFCGHWNRFQAQKIFLKHKVKGIQTYVPVYHVSEIHKCEKCGKVMQKPKELIRIEKVNLYEIH